MKTKLLKKIRKRFIIKNDGTETFYLLDLKKGTIDEESNSYQYLIYKATIETLGFHTWLSLLQVNRLKKEQRKFSILKNL